MPSIMDTLQAFIDHAEQQGVRVTQLRLSRAERRQLLEEYTGVARRVTPPPDPYAPDPYAASPGTFYLPSLSSGQLLFCGIPVVARCEVS